MRIDPGNEDAIPILTKGLKRPEDEWRITAAEGLSRSRRTSKPALPVLIEALNSDKEDHVLRACYALWRMGPDARDAIPALSKLLNDLDPKSEKWPRMLIAGALIKVDSKNTVAQRTLERMLLNLIAALESNKNEGIALFAADVLGQLGSKAEPAIPALRKALATEDLELRSAIENSLRLIEKNK
jgi:HEAT repeat protein